MMSDTEQKSAGQPARAAERLDGVVIGVLTGFADGAVPLVVFPGNDLADGRRARATTALAHDDIGREVALMFERGDPAKPLIIGRLQHPGELARASAASPAVVELDGERLELKAEREIVLRCGKASITLTREGKVLIRGAYLLSRSSGANRIKGGSIQLN